MSNDIMVSVCCLAYNHEKYIRQALDGFIMQKTNFKYEVLIHDDASTDGTADIIREYEKKYPDIIKPIYQKENQHSKGVKISWTYQYPRVKGKYIALCEGDDYWTDEHKLQKQYDCLEKNQDCVFCAHNVRAISEDGKRLEEFYPCFDLSEGIIYSSQWIRILSSNTSYPFQTSCYFYRSEIIKKNIGCLPDFYRLSNVGDIPLMMLCAVEGNLYYINEEMSHYRRFSIGSWTTKYEKDQTFLISSLEISNEVYRAYDKFTNYKYSKEINEKCTRDEFKLLLLKKQYKQLHDKKYKKLYKELSRKEKIYCTVFGMMPWLENYYRRIKSIGKKH